LDLRSQVVAVRDAHAAGVDQFDVAVADPDEAGHAVARDAGGRGDDGDAPAGQPVEQRRLAHGGGPDDGDRGYGHGPTPLYGGRPGPREGDRDGSFNCSARYSHPAGGRVIPSHLVDGWERWDNEAV